VLLAAVTKNDPALVEEALRRKDLVLSPDRLFPIEAGWHPKSESVERILRVWNISADSVVFVDDSPLEAAEVKAAHPLIECLTYPRDDDAVYRLTETLRDLFGKERVLPDDSLRLESIRAAGRARDEVSRSHRSYDDFLDSVEAELTFSFTKDPLDPRALDLVNKTNQFNLNGRRHTGSSWAAHLERPGAWLVRASYRDKFGPLGTIAAISGTRSGKLITVDTWVMSCRAFSRNIEHRCLDVLFDGLEAERIDFAFEETARNGPMRDFLAKMLDASPSALAQLSRETFRERCPRLHHRVLKG
jgi:FkbH-like protein